MVRKELPVRPDLGQLRRQAKELLRVLQSGDPTAAEFLRQHHPERLEPSQARLADAQLALARSYGVPSWPRLALACRTVEAIWRNDAEALRELVSSNPRLLDEDARGVKGNWGPPMSYAAGIGRNRIVALMHELGASDVQYAFDRAVLQGRLDTARRLYALGARATGNTVLGACEAQSSAGLALALELGAPLAVEHGDRLAPVAMLLQTYSRNPAGKHRCLELMVEHGIDLPATPPMAVHRGRSDLLESHLRRDPDLFARTFSHEEIYPPELGCDADHSLALHGTPLDGTTLLHLCVDNDELDLARWLIERGADPDARAEVDAEGFGGHTALFGCVVSQPHRVGRRRDDAFARLLLDSGANPNARASLRKALRFVTDETLHEYRDVTPLAWGEWFHDQDWVSRPVLRLITERGGHR
jgi:Ankyrin repeat